MKAVEVHNAARSRWDQPFDPEMSDSDVERIMTLEPFSQFDKSRFPRYASVARIIRNDTRLVHYKRGELMVRQGDYGNSAFLIISGVTCVVIKPGLPSYLLGRASTKRRSILKALWRAWKPPQFSEIRDSASSQAAENLTLSGEDGQARVTFNNLEGLLAERETAYLQPGEFFGVIGALGRFPRQVSLLAMEDVECLEIRWQGLRDFRRYDAGFREHLDDLFRRHSLNVFVKNTPLFKHCDEARIKRIEAAAVFRTFGEESWHLKQKSDDQSPTQRLAGEHLIAVEGAPADHLILIQSGFVRISENIEKGHHTLGFMGPGRMFGLPEMVHGWRTQEYSRYPVSLRALGFVQTLFIPGRVLEKELFPFLPPDQLPQRPAAWTRPSPLTRKRSNGLHGDLIEWLVEHHFINGV
ncbi:MAG: cyclic nucleotide-binding domain-containing protein, partial [Magnetococcales bacterium]|nr:cyclic nucleotide-binding domain-containing protein [Magnetococcales bacterium]